MTWLWHWIAACYSDVQSSVSSSRIKAKVTGLAKAKANATPPSSSFPSFQPSPTASPFNEPSPTSLANQRMGRTPSISSLSNKEPLFYPITTASPAANVHRFATVRSPTSTRRPSNIFIPQEQTDHTPPIHVDPALIPLPPLSPPSSTLSFSSHSSASRSSVSITSHSTAPTFNAEFNNHIIDHSSPLGPNGSLNKPRSHSFIVHDAKEDGFHITSGDEEERKMRAEAKSNRKVCPSVIKCNLGF